MVSNPDDTSYSGYGFVRVPGYDDALPQLKRGTPPLTVVSEKTLTIHLNDYIVAVGGRSVRLTDAATVRATHANGDDLVVGSDTLQFTSGPRYFGPASISFQVTDGSSASDPHGNVATIVLPIQVTPRDNQPPVFTGALIDFEPGQTKTIDLTKLTSYPYAKDQSELVYTVQDPRPAGVTVSLDKQQLTIQVATGTLKGSHPSIAIGVKDAVNTGQAGRIDLNIVPSTRPLASPQPDRVIAPRGQTTSVDVLANDGATNPFPSKPLTVVGVRGLGSGSLPQGVSITPSADRSTLTVHVSSTAAPADTTVQYEVADATGDPDRYTWGTVTVSVQDRPAAVSNVQVTAFGDRTLTLSWIPGAFNNSPITGFDVLVSRPGGPLLSTTACSTTTCAVPTPGNGPDNAVTVSVVAKNALGASDPTGYVEPVWSDVIPAAPSGVSSQPLDHGLRVTWTKPADASGASPISSYLVTVGGTVSSLVVTRTDPVGTAYAVNVTDAGIPNGAPVAITVASRNDFYAGRTSWNQTQSSGVPAGAPLLAGAAPVATPSRTDGTTATLSWGNVFSDNGKADQRLLRRRLRRKRDAELHGDRRRQRRSPAPGRPDLRNLREDVGRLADVQRAPAQSRLLLRGVRLQRAGLHAQRDRHGGSPRRPRTGDGRQHLGPAGAERRRALRLRAAGGDLPCRKRQQPLHRLPHRRAERRQRDRHDRRHRGDAHRAERPALRHAAHPHDHERLRAVRRRKRSVQRPGRTVHRASRGGGEHTDRRAALRRAHRHLHLDELADRAVHRGDLQLRRAACSCRCRSSVRPHPAQRQERHPIWTSSFGWAATRTRRGTPVTAWDSVSRAILRDDAPQTGAAATFAPAAADPTPQRGDSMTMTPEQAGWFSGVFDRLVSNIDRVLLGKHHIIRLALTALFSEGHLLLEDYPGTGKTSLARAIAQSVRGSSNRVQFTPDLLPGDITGVNIFDQRQGGFEFHRGPIFANIVLADEINRASPKTQSALLEVMEEEQVTVDGVRHAVAAPFMVIATQNPIEQAGTYRLPEAQLDRFLMKASIGYPDHEATLRILEGSDRRAHEVVVPEVIGAATVVEMAAMARTVHVDATINDYVSRLVDATRTADEVRLGVSVRGALALVRASKTLAAASGRYYVTPDDVKALAEPVLAHRLVLDPEAEFEGVTPSSIVGQLLVETPPPSDRAAV